MTESSDTQSGKPQRVAEDVPLPGGNFRLFIQRLAYQGLMNLGLIENPMTKAVRVDLDHAGMLIDDLSMIEEKTQGNLDEEEQAHLTKVISDLRFHLQKLRAEA